MWKVYDEVRGQLSGIRYLLPPLCGCSDRIEVVRLGYKHIYLLKHHTHSAQMIFKSVKGRKVFEERSTWNLHLSKLCLGGSHGIWMKVDHEARWENKGPEGLFPQAT